MDENTRKFRGYQFSDEQLEALMDLILYGDTCEIPLSVLGSKCPTQDKWEAMDEEQHVRLGIAATVKAHLKPKVLDAVRKEVEEATGSNCP